MSMEIQTVWLPTLFKICDPGPQKKIRDNIYTSSESWINKLSIDV